MTPSRGRGRPRGAPGSIAAEPKGAQVQRQGDPDLT